MKPPEKVITGTGALWGDRNVPSFIQCGFFGLALNKKTFSKTYFFKPRSVPVSSHMTSGVLNFSVILFYPISLKLSSKEGNFTDE
jgi:hypothetical protein